MKTYEVPLVIRGKIIRDMDAEFEGRRGGVRFCSPDVKRHVHALVQSKPSSLAELYDQTFEEIIEFLGQVGKRLEFETNPYLQEAFELSCLTSGLSEQILRYCYQNLPVFFSADFLRDMVEQSVGVRYLEGWVEGKLVSGGSQFIRAFGARSVHIIAGNVPGVAALSIVRNAVTRSDAIIKTPSNDPLTGVAIARTMAEFAPDHPITRHLSVVYWKGGNDDIESAVYQPRNVEKIIAWGGFASIKHISKYLQPGIDLITLDPKLSSTIIGREAFGSEATMGLVAKRLANDVGAYNQEACVNARVVYIETGLDAKGLALANRFGEMLYQAVQSLPQFISGPAKALDQGLDDEIRSLKLTSEDFKVIGGALEGGVIVSQIDEPVEFSRILANRIANLVPVDSLETPIRAVTAYTQTIGIYPESLKALVRDRLAFHGAQRLVSLGYAANMEFSGPQDAIEPLRRMCKWIVDQAIDPRETRMPSEAVRFSATADQF